MKLDPKVARRLKDRPYYAYLHARNIVGGRLPPLVERVFISDPRSAYLYAKHVVKGKLPDHVHNGLILSSFEKQDDQKSLQMYLSEFCKD